MKITVTTNAGVVIEALTSEDELDGLALPAGFTWADAKSLGSTIEDAILDALRKAEQEEAS